MSWKKLCLLGVAALAACGGDDDDNNNSTPPGDQVLTGTLLDAPVINIDYSTDTQSVQALSFIVIFQLKNLIHIRFKLPESEADDLTRQP